MRLIREVRQRRPPKRSAAHLKWVTDQPCCVPGCRNHPVAPHHVRIGHDGGTALKPSDTFCVPLCVFHHDEVHRGARTFERTHNLDLRRIARDLAASSGAPE